MHIGSGSFTCNMCGQQIDGVSIISLAAGYGSKHDGKCRTVELCGDCYDKLSSIINIMTKGNRKGISQYGNNKHGS